MPLDPSIIGQLRAPQAPNSLAQLAQVMQLQQMQNSGRLADLQYQQETQMAPMRLETMRLQQDALRQAKAKAARIEAFNSPQNLAQFMQPGRPAYTLPEAVEGPVQGAEPPKMNLQALLAGGVAAGVIDPLTYAKEQIAEQKPNFAPSRSPGHYVGGRWVPTPENIPPPAAPTPLPIMKAIEQRDALPLGHPNRRILDQYITHLSNPQSQRIIIPPQPRNLQLTTDERGNQLIVNPDGTTRPLTTTDGTGVRKPIAADKPMTEFQGKAALYGTRAAQSDKILKEMEDEISTTGLAAKQAAGNVPVIGGLLGVAGNLMLSSNQQRVEQAQRDFVNAVLRQESGAVISDAEFANAKKQYFPQPGDNQKVKDQKRSNRLLAIQGFARMSGPKGAVDIKAIMDNPLLPGTPATAKKDVRREADEILGLE